MELLALTYGFGGNGQPCGTATVGLSEICLGCIGCDVSLDEVYGGAKPGKEGEIPGRCAVVDCVWYLISEGGGSHVSRNCSELDDDKADEEV